MTDGSREMPAKRMQVPYSAINRFEDGFVAKWLERVETISKAAQFVGGEWNAKLQTRLASESGTSEVRLCGNGTDALQLALRACQIGAGHHVLIPDLTFWATFEAVCNVGARPITVDVHSTDLHPSVEFVEEAIEKFKPDAMILAHLYGWAARDTKAIRMLCGQKQIPLIEDSAQAWGVRLDGDSVFSGARISTASFFPGKVLGAAGDGGAVLTNDPDLARQVELLANHGRTGKFEHRLVGWNSRLDAIQSAYLDLCLDYLPGRILGRRHRSRWNRSIWKNILPRAF